MNYYNNGLLTMDLQIKLNFLREAAGAGQTISVIQSYLEFMSIQKKHPKKKSLLSVTEFQADNLLVRVFKSRNQFLIKEIQLFPM